MNDINPTVRNEFENRGAAAANQEAVALAASPYVEWSAIFAGAFVSLAIAFVLLTFGAAVGLSAVSPWTSTRGSIAAVTIGAAFWMMLTHVWAFGLGGYLAGRMRHRRSGAAASEIEFRDGVHGVAVWGLAVTATAVMGALVAASLTGGGRDLNTSSSARALDPTTVATDFMLRTTRPTSEIRADGVRDEVTRLLIGVSARTPISSADRTYLNELVATRTGLAPPEAAKRVDDAITLLKDGTNRARKAAVMLGFITAATLLLSAAAAWWAATVGGKHRDEGTLWAGLARHERSSIWN